MDDLTTLRRLDADVPAPTEQALSGAFAALQDRMGVERSRPTAAARRFPVRRSLVLSGLGVAAAGAIAVALVGVGPAPSASAVSRTLRAAATSVTASGVATEGTEVHYTRLVTSGGGTEDGRPVAESAVLLEGTLTLERTSTDVWTRSTAPLQPIGAWGPDGDRLRQQAEDEFEAKHGEPDVARSSASRWFWDLGPKQIAALPRDPEALSRTLQGVTADPDSAYVPNTQRAIDSASAVLESGLADAELQAAVYRALEQLPGLLLDEHAKDLDGRSGVGIGTLVSDDQQRIDIVIDPTTGRFLGRTETNLKAINGAPAGTAYESTAVYPR